MDFVSVIKIAIVFTVLVYLHTLWAKRRIRQWAKRNDTRIIQCRLRLFDLGPFSYFSTSGGQSVFRIQAVDSTGKSRSGYARAGGYFFGLIRKRVEVKWDKE